MAAKIGLNSSKIRGVLLGAASAAAMVGICAGDAHAVPQPAPVEHATIVLPADEPRIDPAPSNEAVRKIGLIAAAGGVLAALFRLVGARRIVRAIGETSEAAAEAVRAAVAAPVAAVRSMAGELARPVRTAAAFFGLAVLALFGAGLFDIEWLLGLLIGAGSVLSVWRAHSRARPSQQVAPVGGERPAGLD